MTPGAASEPAPPVSVVVASWGRPDLLPRALTSLYLQDHPRMEVVVVADAAGLAAAATLPFGRRLKRVGVAAANLSAARNAGIAAAAGTVVAFLDDDAVAEPTWARRLTAPFADPAVVAACGFVRGRSGVRWQWRAATVTGCGVERPMDVPWDPSVPWGASVHAAPTDGAVKTVGTNAAFRRAALVDCGGFDDRFRYFLDETDLNLRMAERGGLTAVVPGAEVHHGYAASASRRADRAPRDLTEIGASVAVFLTSHCDAAERARAESRFREEQRTRALRHLVTGALEPRDIGGLMRSFDLGLAEGRLRQRASAPAFGDPPPFQPLRESPLDPAQTFVAGLSRRAQGRQRALEAAVPLSGPVTLMLASPVPRRHRVRFRMPGYWEHVLGPGAPRHSNLRLAPFCRRVHEECRRMEKVREDGV